MTRALRLLVVAILAVVSACYDPVHADEVAALGPEAPGVPEGPTHRAGQRCTTCHDGRGPGEPEFSIAGTVYRVRGQTAPLVDGKVTITDATGRALELTTNSVGNFYIERDKFDPVYPLKTFVQGEGSFARMTTTIGRDGGCATCHRSIGDPQHVEAIFLKDKP